MTAARLALATAISAVLALGCQDTPPPQPVRSLERSGDVSFLCAASEDVLNPGRHIDDCPDFEDGSDHLYGLVTQTTRGEVAVIDLSAGVVTDVAPDVPGFNFLPIGAQPGDIVSTPGGSATFVGVAELGYEGIFALPTACIDAPGEDEPPRDLPTWPACALPAAPGQMRVLIDPPSGDADDAKIRASCDSGYDIPVGESTSSTERSGCEADLGLETNPPGRRKLAVALPDMGLIAVVDAQELLDRPQGSFDPCPVERWVELPVDLPSGDIEQRVPEDLKVDGCTIPGFNHGPTTGDFIARPAGMDLSRDTLYIADQSAPVIHRLQVADPCAPTLAQPLLPVSFTEPGRVVTTSRVAVSPSTTDGESFAYAIDEKRGDVMIFDVSPSSSERTPIVRSRADRNPNEPPDRIRFGAPARDISFALRDRPIADPVTGVAVFGQKCDPDPSLSVDAPAAQYRTAQNFGSGAAPFNLRGIFGFIALDNGQIAIIDVEDYDAPCRRPIVARTEPTEDFRGCAGDDPDGPQVFTQDGELDGLRTASGEVSCHMVDRHRARSATFFARQSDSATRAPGLRSFPRLSSEDGVLPTDQTEGGRENPKLLAVDYRVGGQAEIQVASTLYTQDSAQNPLVIAPAAAERNSLALLMNEPRAFRREEDFSLTYEGTVVGERPAGFLAFSDSGTTVDGLRDTSGLFCNRGVHDESLMRERGVELGVPDAELDAFATEHADYIQIVSDFPAEDASYWNTSVGIACGGRTECEAEFGEVDTPTASRDLRILAASQTELKFEPRVARSSAGKRALSEALACCFPEAVRYRVRAGSHWVLAGSATGSPHRVTTSADGQCVLDCNPLRRFSRSRVFEVSCSGCEAVGEAEGVTACRDDNADGGISSDNACVFENLTQRFAVYRGQQPSIRDMSFTWKLIGGFATLSANLASETTSVSPQSMTFVPQIGQLAIADGAAEGLALVSLNSIAVSTLYF